jgi:hypothetical protein
MEKMHNDPDAITLKDPEGHGDAVANLVRTRLHRARLHRASVKVGRFSLEQVLRNSFEQYHSIPNTCDMDLLEASGIDVMFSLTKHKTDVLVAWLHDLILNQVQMPFHLEPTPIVELSDRAHTKARGAIKDQLFGQGFAQGPEALLSMVKAIKDAEIEADNKWAKEATVGMERVIKDQGRCPKCSQLLAGRVTS